MERAVSSATAQPVTVRIDDAHQVSGLLLVPPQARACYVLAHGAGAGMTHPFLDAVASELGARGVASLRYQFPYMQQGSKRPDPPGLAQAAVRGAVAEAARLTPDLPLVAGGKSFGGRMTSQAQAVLPLPGVHGLAFLGFPLHPAGWPADDRGRHLFGIQVPMLFLQGERDKLADQQLLGQLVERLGALATLRLFQDADHSFHVPARTGRKDAEVRSALADALVAWTDSLMSRPAATRRSSRCRPAR
jgi:uncharacterized protein